MPTKQKSWDKVFMIRAVEAVLNKEMGLLKASKTFNVPRSTIKDYVKINGRNTVEALIGRKPVLLTEVEEELVRYCLVMGHKYYGLCAKDVKRVTYSLGIRNGARHPFSREKETAGESGSSCFSEDTLTCHSGNRNVCLLQEFMASPQRMLIISFPF
jgi:hypothetical protein